MNFAQVRDMAKEMGLKTGRVSKVDLIRSIQEAESNIPCSAPIEFNTVEKRGPSGVMSVKTAIKPELCGSRLRSYEYIGIEHMRDASCEKEDHNFFGFSNSIGMCRCLRGYCVGRDSNCIRDPGSIAILFSGIKLHGPKGSALTNMKYRLDRLLPDGQQ